MIINSCPFCGKSFPEELADGIIYCANCNHMVDSSLTNKLLSVYRSLLKSNGSNANQIKHQEKLDEKNWQIIMDAFENCLSFEDFQSQLKTHHNN